MTDLSAVESIFHAALERPTPEARASYLDAACPNPEVRRQVERLLAAHPQVGDFLKPSDGELTEDHGTIQERPGMVIGPYKLMEQIGEGGMGLVFVAEQQHAVRRKVALKIIKPGMDSRDVIARFEAERQALALMDHPNIARVFDAGTTDSGRPYFVMELVRGIPIVEYCDGQQLTTRERLDLFLSVCQAVQHAHGKGIIHRDLKPSNILVAPHDGEPVVKVIDFGVAKAIGQQLTDKTIYTRFAQMIGTPLYMSPEQAEIERARRGYPQRRLQPGRAPLRALDRHDAVRQGAVRDGGLRRDPADHPGGGAAPAEHPVEHAGRDAVAGLGPAQDRAGQAVGPGPG